MRPSTGAARELELVEVHHPKLRRTIEVPKQSVKHHERAGWRLATTSEQETKREAPEASGVSSSPEESSRRRRSKEGE